MGVLPETHPNMTVQHDSVTTCLIWVCEEIPQQQFIPAAGKQIDRRACSVRQIRTLLQPDSRMRRRYNRCDTPARLYRRELARDRMRSVEIPPTQEGVAVKPEEARREAPPRPRSESRQRTALVAVRLLPQERDTLAQSARSRGVTLSEFIRASAMRTAGTPAPEPDSR
jgi:hypothetical protein